MYKRKIEYILLPRYVFKDIIANLFKQLKVMKPVTAAIQPLHPSKVWDDISPQFLATFWSLTLYDLFVPENVYAKELVKKKAEITKIDDNRELNNTRKKKEKERINSMIEKVKYASLQSKIIQISGQGKTFYPDPKFRRHSFHL